MNSRQTILVAGADSAEGSGVAASLLKRGRFNVRVLAADTSTPRIVALHNAGAQIVPGCIDDNKTLETSMSGCYGMFYSPVYKGHFDEAYQRGKMLVDIAGRSGINHFVLHTSPGYAKLSAGQLPVPRCDLKFALQEYAERLGIPATFVQTTFYYENFFRRAILRTDANGDYYFGFPQGDTKLAMSSVEDVGRVVSAVFNQPGEYMGRTFGIVGSDNNCREYAGLMTSVLGEKISYQYVHRDEYAALDFAAARDLANMFEVQRLYIRDSFTDLLESNYLNPNMQTFKSWLLKNKNKFEAYFESRQSGAVVIV